RGGNVPCSYQRHTASLAAPVPPNEAACSRRVSTSSSVSTRLVGIAHLGGGGGDLDRREAHRVQHGEQPGEVRAHKAVTVVRLLGAPNPNVLVAPVVGQLAVGVFVVTLKHDDVTG